MEIKHKSYSGERSLYSLKNASLFDVTFLAGESPLKECSSLTLDNCTFKYKYPLWYSKDIIVKNSLFEETARSGIWYSENLSFEDVVFNSPKTFRKSKNITLKNVDFNNAEETLYFCDKVTINNAYIKGDYCLLGSSNIEIVDSTIEGNYCFDNASNIKAKNCTFLSRDAFWNVKDAVIEDSVIDGEYLAWNSSNITFIRCKIISHQGLCYSKNVKLIDCQITNSDLIFEYCENIDADIDVENVSIKNPRSGSIFLSKGCKIIKNEKYIDPNKTKIVIK